MEHGNQIILYKNLQYFKEHLILDDLEDPLMNVFPKKAVIEIFRIKDDSRKYDRMVEMLCKQGHDAMDKFLVMLNSTDHSFVENKLRHEREAAYIRKLRESRTPRGTWSAGYHRISGTDSMENIADDDGVSCKGGINQVRDEMEDIKQGFQKMFKDKFADMEATQAAKHEGLKAEITGLQKQLNEKDLRISQLEENQEQMIEQHKRELARVERKVQWLEKDKAELQLELQMYHDSASSLEVNSRYSPRDERKRGRRFDTRMANAKDVNEMAREIMELKETLQQMSREHNQDKAESKRKIRQVEQEKENLQAAMSPRLPESPKPSPVQTVYCTSCY